MMRKLSFFAVVSLLAGGSRPAIADEPPDQFVVAMVGTTVLYQPSGGRMGGPLGDVTPMIGAAWFATDALALELDAGPTFVAGEYAAFSFTPGLVWAFHSVFYGALRLGVPVHPEPNLVLLPGVGAIWVLDSGYAPYVELGVSSAVGRGEPDLGFATTVGVVRLF